MTLSQRSWWMYPFKPVKTTKSIFSKIDLTKYTMEVKLNGWRSIAIFNGIPKLFTRHKNQIQIPSDLSKQITNLNLPLGTVLDGEIWDPNKRGGWKTCQPGGCYLSVWDIIRLGTKDLSKEPIETRRKILNSLMKKDCPNIRSVKIFKVSLNQCNQIHQRAIEHQTQRNFKHGFIHGVVLKKNGSLRHDHSTTSITHPDWLKIVFFQD